MLSRLIYTSVIARNIRFSDVEDIAQRSATRNAALGISGLLVYTPSHFVQVLEGERDAVQDVYARVRRDPRHTRVRTVSDDLVHERAFGEWGMKATMPNVALRPESLEGLGPEAALDLLMSLRSVA